MGETTLGNLFADLPRRLTDERVELLVATGRVRLERIVSTGHATPHGQWYDQDTTEWVAVLRGRAGAALPRMKTGPGCRARATGC